MRCCASVRRVRVRRGRHRASPFALRGCVLTPGQAFDPGWVVVTGDAIAEVRDTSPDYVRVVDTGGWCCRG